MNADRGRRGSRAPLVYGWLAGVLIGAAALVFGPMIRPLDANYLIPTHWSIVFLISGFVSAVCVFLLGRGWLSWSVANAAGVMCAFVIRVAIDIAHDRTNHNLLPFELIIDFVSVFLCSLIGGGLGYMVRRRADRPGEQGPWTPRWR